MRCPVCGKAHAACGPLTTTPGLSIEDAPRREANTVDDLREYRLIINGSETTAMLTEADAKRAGAVPLGVPVVVPDVVPDVPEVKARPVTTAARTPANKAR